MKLLLLILFSWHSQVFAAACCGGGSAVSSVITSDDQAQVSSLFSEGIVVVDNVDSQGIWRKWDEHQKLKTLRIDAAVILSDLWQIGASIPVIQRTRQNVSYSGLSDINMNIGYEYLPEWNYSEYRPKGIGFLQITLPTGKSKVDSDVGGLDSRGNGLWALGVGTILTKNLQSWDVSTALDIHRSFNRRIHQYNLEPGWGGNFSVGLGYNLKDYRLGSSVMWTYEDAVRIDESAGSIERYATASLSASYLMNDEWTGTLSYSDQTLFGDPINTSLGQTFAFQIQKRWAR